MATTFKLTAYNTADTAVAGTSMNALANSTGFAYGAEIDNSTDLYTHGDLSLVLSSAVTSVAPAYLAVYLIPNVDGNYVATTGNPGASYLVGTTAVTAGSITNIQVRGLVISQKFKIVLSNNLGVAFPSTNTSVCALRRYSLQSV